MLTGPRPVRCYLAALTMAAATAETGRTMDRVDVETKYGPVQVYYSRGRAGDMSEFHVRGDLRVHGVEYRALSLYLVRAANGWECVWDSVYVPARSVTLNARRTILEEFCPELVAWLTADSAERHAAEVAYWRACAVEADARVDQLREEMRVQLDRRADCRRREDVLRQAACNHDAAAVTLMDRDAPTIGNCECGAAVYWWATEAAWRLEPQPRPPAEPTVPDARMCVCGHTADQHAYSPDTGEPTVCYEIIDCSPLCERFREVPA